MRFVDALTGTSKESRKVARRLACWCECPLVNALRCDALTVTSGEARLLV